MPAAAPPATATDAEKDGGCVRPRPLIFHLIALQVGPQIMLAAKLRMTPGLGLDEAIDHINELERDLHEQVPDLGWLFMEPDIRN